MTRLNICGGVINDPDNQESLKVSDTTEIIYELRKVLKNIETLCSDFETCSSVQHKLKCRGAFTLARAALKK